MSIICENSNGWVLDHANFIESVYLGVDSETKREFTLKQCLNNFCFRKELFKIITPFVFDSPTKNSLATKRAKRKKLEKTTCSDHSISPIPCSHPEVNLVRSSLEKLVLLAQENGHFTTRLQEEDFVSNNEEAREFSASFFNTICQNNLMKYSGGNAAKKPVLVDVYGRDYLIPNNSKFYNCDVQELYSSIPDTNNFDFLLLDPPWWNKYVRRRKTKQETGGYKMMYNEEVCTLPVERWLAPRALVAVWCTNCPRHEQDVVLRWFSRWRLHHIATWYWVKVTQTGVPVCQFSPPPGKQPYERLLFGATEDRLDQLPPDNKCIVSVPSAIHSHKPPLSDVMKPYLPPQPRCLELFARYLLPNWSSAGDQVLALQNLKLYTQI